MLGVFQESMELVQGDQSITPERNSGRKNFLEFLRMLLDHDCMSTGCESNPQEHIFASLFCQVDYFHLVEWSNKQEQRFRVKMFDGRKGKDKQPPPQCMAHFLLYAKHVAKQGDEVENSDVKIKEAKEKMKATLQKNVNTKALRLISNKSETDVKEYQFVDTPRSPYDPLGGPRSGSSIENITPPPQTGHGYYMLSSQGSGSSYGSQNSGGSSSNSQVQLSYQSPESGYGSVYSGDFNTIIPVPPEINQPTFMQLDKPSEYQLATQYTVAGSTNQGGVFVPGQDGGQNSSNFNFVKDENYPEMPWPQNFSEAPYGGNSENLTYPFANVTMNNAQNIHTPHSFTNTQQSMFIHSQDPRQQQTFFSNNTQYNSTSGANFAWTGPVIYRSQENTESSGTFNSNQMISGHANHYSSYAAANTHAHPESAQVSATQVDYPENETVIASGEVLPDFEDLMKIEQSSPFTQKSQNENNPNYLRNPLKSDFPSPPQFNSFLSESASSSSGSTRSNPQPRKSIRLDNISDGASTVSNEFNLVPPEPKPVVHQFRATLEKFVNFVWSSDEAGFELESEDIVLLKNREKMRKQKAWPSNMADLKIEIYAKLKPDERMQMWKPLPVREAVSPGGFRLVRMRDLDLNYDDVHRFGPKSLEGKNLDLVDLDLKNVMNDNVNKCLETFERSGVVFLWRHYEEPGQLSTAVQSPEVRSMLCRRLYCYRISKGYPSRNAQEKEKHDQQMRLKMLDMCICPAGLQSEGIELEVHAEFLQVFDILKETLLALKIQRNMLSNVEVISTDELRKQKSNLRVYLGLQSTKRYNSSSLPMRIEITNNFVEDLVTEKSSFGEPESDHHSRGTRSISCKSEGLMR